MCDMRTSLDAEFPASSSEAPPSRLIVVIVVMGLDSALILLLAYFLISEGVDVAFTLALLAYAIIATAPARLNNAATKA